VPRKTPGLLDLVPGAAAAYSLRSLSRSYAGPVVTVRRSSDDAEEDFTAAEVADGTLAAFCGAGDGFVKQWWDQSGNGNHAVAAADANEPQIVDSGVVVTEEGKPALQFDGVDDLLDCGKPLIASVGTCSIYAVIKSDRTTSDPGNFPAVSQYQTGVAGRARFIAYNPQAVGYNTFIDGATDLSLLSDFSTDQQVLTSLQCATANAGSLYINGAIQASGTGVNASVQQTNTTIGDTVEVWYGSFQELIIYTADLSSQRELIEGNIAWSYS